LQKTDLVHGVESGIVVGGGIGVILGILLVQFPPDGLQLSTMVVLATGLTGALFGAWVSGMVAAAIPNSRLKSFLGGIEKGQVLLMVDVPFKRIAEIEALIAKRHPEIRYGGMEPHIPAFP